MAEGKRSKRTKGEARAVVREERRFLPGRDARLTASLVAGGLGSMLLGAGVYIQFLRPPENPMAVKLGSQIVELADKGSFVVGAGALILAAVILLAPDLDSALLVGDGGVGVDDGTEEGARRILWCDIDKLTFANDALVVHGPDFKISAPLASQAQAAAWILREARARIPSIIGLDHAEQERIPAALDDAGERRKLTDSQTAGRRCRATDRVISYEPDARLCPRCSEIYHKDHVPEACLTCEGPLGADAAKAGLTPRPPPPRTTCPR